MNLSDLDSRYEQLVYFANKDKRTLPLELGKKEVTETKGKKENKPKLSVAEEVSLILQFKYSRFKRDYGDE